MLSDDEIDQSDNESEYEEDGFVVDEIEYNDDDLDEEEDADEQSSEDEVAKHERELLEFDQQEGEELEGLNEFEREQVLAERAEKRQQLLEKIEIKKRLQAESRRKTRKKRTESSNKSKTKKGIQVLKERRSKKRQGIRDADSFFEELDEDYNEIADEVFEDEELYRERIKKSIHGASYRAGSTEKLPPTLEELSRIRVTRNQLEKWAYAPFFEETIAGCFVRLSLGVDRNKYPVYRVAQIIKVVDHDKIYKVNNLSVKTALRLKHGKAEKDFTMNMISNGSITESEYNRWVSTMKNEKQRFVSITEIDRLHEQLQSALNHTFTDEEINFMVELKKKTFSVPRNLTMEKVNLLGLKAKAEEEGDTYEAERLENELKNIDEQLGDPRIFDGGDMNKDVWNSLNQRNRLKNLEEGSKAEKKARQERLEKQISGRSKVDPFARIKSVPTHVFVTPGPGNEVKNGPSNDSTQETSAGVSFTRPEEDESKKQYISEGPNANVFMEALKDIEIDV